MICGFAFAVFILSYGFGVASPAAGVESVQLSGSSPPPLDVFEVQAPLRKSYEGTACQQVIVQHNFAASYGTPFVGGCLLTLRLRTANGPQEHTHHQKTASSQPPSSTSQ